MLVQQEHVGGKTFDYSLFFPRGEKDSYIFLTVDLFFCLKIHETMKLTSSFPTRTFFDVFFLSLVTFLAD